LIPLEMELVLDGTGGMYPGNSFHSSYLPQKYKDKTVFQMFDVNHTVNDGGWSTTIGGKMRTTISQTFTKIVDDPDLLDDLIDNYRKDKQGEVEIILNTKEPAEDKVIPPPEDPDDLLPDWYTGYTIEASRLDNNDNTAQSLGYTVRTNEMELRGGAGGTKQKWGYIIEKDEKGNVENK